MIVFLRRLTGALLRAHDALVTFSYWLGAGALGLIVAIFAYEVFSRYLMDAPTKWASDFVSFLLLISLFLVLPHVTRSDGNVSVPILLNMLGRRASDLMRRLGFGLGAAVCLWAGYIFLDETLRLIDRGTATLTSVQVPKWILFAFLVFGMVNAGLSFLRLAFGGGSHHMTQATL